MEEQFIALSGKIKYCMNKKIIYELTKGKANRSVLSCQLRAIFKTLKYLNKEKIIFTKRTIKELSPWTTRMVKTILKKDVKDIPSALDEILKNGAETKDIQKAFYLSPKYRKYHEL